MHNHHGRKKHEGTARGCFNCDWFPERWPVSQLRYDRFCLMAYQIHGAADQGTDRNRYKRAQWIRELVGLLCEAKRTDDPTRYVWDDGLAILINIV